MEHGNRHSDIQAGVYTLRLDELNDNGIVEGRLELPFKENENTHLQKERLSRPSVFTAKLISEKVIMK